MKRSFGLVSLTLPALLLSSCGSYLAFGYVRYITVDTEAIVTTSYVNLTQIYVFKDASLKPNPNDYEQPFDYRMACSEQSFMEFTFSRFLGKETIEDVDYLLIAKEKVYYVSISIKKTGETNYSSEKQIYFNGVAVTIGGDTKNTQYDSENLRSYLLDDYGLKQSNPNGRINQSILNTFEYK